jgi:hypothetical protein
VRLGLRTPASAFKGIAKNRANARSGTKVLAIVADVSVSPNGNGREGRFALSL